MNSLLGGLLFVCVVAATVRRDRSAGVGTLLVTTFWGIFAFFVLAKPGSPLMPIDEVAWYWVDATLFPAVVLTGFALAKAVGPWRSLSRTLAIMAMVYATLWTTYWGFVFGAA